MRLRQIAFAARDLDATVADLRAGLGLGAPFHDPGVAIFGLRNAVLPLGDTFLEVVSPVEAETAAGRYMHRQGGDCGYMVMVQVEDTDAARRRAAALGVRTVWSIDLDDIRGTHFHPRDLGGPLLSVDTPTPPTAWRWAGDDWPQRSAAGAPGTLVGVEMTCPDPAAVAHRWAELLGRPLAQAGATWRIDLDGSALRFTAVPAGTAGGIAAIDLSLADRAVDRHVCATHLRTL
ncbi:MAG: VOC family protein [Candidatus Binatia bacterium]